MFKPTSIGKKCWDTYLANSGYFDMALGSTLNSLMITMMKILIGRRGIPTTAVFFVRMLTTTLAAAIYLLVSQRRNLSQAFFFTPEARPWLMLRGVVGTASFWMMYKSLKFIRMEDQQAIWYLCPIITSAIALLCLGDAWTWLEMASGAVSVIGMLMIVQPGALASTSTVSGLESLSTSDLALGLSLAIFGTAFGAWAYVIVRRMGRSVSVITILFHFGWISTLSMAGVMIISAKQSFPQEARDAQVVGLLLGTAFAGTGATFFNNRAVQSQRPGRVTLIMYLQLPFVLLLDYLVFEDYANNWSIAGCVIVICSAIVVAFKKDNDVRVHEKVPCEEEVEPEEGDSFIVQVPLLPQNTEPVNVESRV